MSVITPFGWITNLCDFLIDQHSVFLKSSLEPRNTQMFQLNSAFEMLSFVLDQSSVSDMNRLQISLSCRFGMICASHSLDRNKLKPTSGCPARVFTAVRPVLHAVSQSDLSRMTTCLTWTKWLKFPKGCLFELRKTTIKLYFTVLVARRLSTSSTFSTFQHGLSHIVDVHDIRSRRRNLNIKPISRLALTSLLVLLEFGHVEWKEMLNARRESWENVRMISSSKFFEVILFQHMKVIYNTYNLLHTWTRRGSHQEVIQWAILIHSLSEPQCSPLVFRSRLSDPMIHMTMMMIVAIPGWFEK